MFLRLQHLLHRARGRCCLQQDYGKFALLGAPSMRLRAHLSQALAPVRSARWLTLSSMAPAPGLTLCSLSVGQTMKVVSKAIYCPTSARLSGAKSVRLLGTA